MHGVGNDFVVIDSTHVADFADDKLCSLAIKVCNRHFGVGADGLLLFTPQVTGFDFRIFNADGSEDSMCGNGLRCVASLCYESGMIPREGFAVTRDGPIPYSVLKKGDVQLRLGAPRFGGAAVRSVLTTDFSVNKYEQELILINTGSPHAVIVCGDGLCSDAVFETVSPVIERSPLFPEHISVNWIYVRSDHLLDIRTYERGVGETLGCGTGACGAAVVAIALGLVISPVSVRSAGGTVAVTWDKDVSDILYLEGPAERVYAGTYAFFTLGVT